MIIGGWMAGGGGGRGGGGAGGAVGACIRHVLVSP